MNNGLGTRGKLAETLGNHVDVMNKFAPAEHLANEALFACQRQFHIENIRDDTGWQEAVNV
jgi:hypothetical protein